MDPRESHAKFQEAGIVKQDCDEDLNEKYLVRPNLENQISGNGEPKELKGS